MKPGVILFGFFNLLLAVFFLTPVLFCTGEENLLLSTSKCASRFIWALPESLITFSRSGLFSGMSLHLPALVRGESVCMHEYVRGVTPACVSYRSLSPLPSEALRCFV